MFSRLWIAFGPRSSDAPKGSRPCRLWRSIGWSGRHLANDDYEHALTSTCSCGRTFQAQLGPSAHTHSHSTSSSLGEAEPVPPSAGLMIALPADYGHHLKSSGPKEGLLKIGPGWFRLWVPQDVEQQNRNYRVQARAPGFVAFGSSGGCELFAFDKQHRIVVLPLVDMTSQSATLLCETWADFVRAIKRPSPPPAQPKKRKCS